MTIEILGSIPSQRTLCAIVRTGTFRPGAEGFDKQGSLRTQCTLHLGLVVRETAFHSNPFKTGLLTENDHVWISRSVKMHLLNMQPLLKPIEIQIFRVESQNY